MGARIAFVSALLVMATLAVFQWELARGSTLETARTAAVNMLVAGELVYLSNVRFFTASAFRRGVLTGNPVALWVAVVLVAFQLVFTYAPPMQSLFSTAALDLTAWLAISALACAIFLAVEAEKALLRRRGVQRM
jgi:magnesium-transporting ATPase (P-type)